MSPVDADSDNVGGSDSGSEFGHSAVVLADPGEQRRLSGE